jgi:hypothetical protein
MRTMLRLIIVLLGGALHCAWADAPLREVDVFLKPAMINEYHGSLDLGELDPGHLEKIILKVQSDSDTDLAYDSVQSSCGCVAAVKSIGKLSIQAVNRLEVELKIPKTSTEIASASYISALMGGVPRFTIEFKYALKKTVIVPAAMAIEEVTESSREHRFEIPFVHSADVSKEVVVGDWSSNVRQSITSQLDFDAKKFQCVLDVTKMTFPETALFTISTGAASVSIPVVFNLKSSLKVYPTAIRLVEPKEADGTFHGSLIVRDSTILGPDATSTLAVTARVIDGQKLKATATNVSKGTWRVRVDVHADIAKQLREHPNDQPSAQCELVFVNSTGRYVERMPLLLPR